MSLYRDVADALRERINSGELAPGEPVPSSSQLARDHRTGRDTALKALKILRHEGLCVLGRDNVVRVGPMERRAVNGGPPISPATIMEVPPGGVVRARMPTPNEAEELGLPDGVPVLVVDIGDVQEVHAATDNGFRWPPLTH